MGRGPSRTSAAVQYQHAVPVLKAIPVQKHACAVRRAVVRYHKKDSPLALGQDGIHLLFNIIPAVIGSRKYRYAAVHTCPVQHLQCVHPKISSARPMADSITLSMS